MVTVFRGVWVAALGAALVVAPVSAAPQERGRGQVIEIAPSAPRAAPRAPRDTSGRARQGTAAVMDAARLRALAASGRRVDPGSAVAGSATLPAGATARVRNLENGQETVVSITDLGPPPGDALVEVTPGVAERLGIRGGMPPVRVAPLAVPQPDGTIRLGEGTGLSGQIAAPALSDRPVD